MLQTASSESFTYDAASNLATHVTRKGDTIRVRLRHAQPLCTKTYAASAVACGGTSSNYLASYAYDLDGRLTAANDNSSSETQSPPWAQGRNRGRMRSCLRARLYAEKILDLILGCRCQVGRQLTIDWVESCFLRTLLLS